MTGRRTPPARGFDPAEFEARAARAQAIMRRHELKSTLMTSNRPLEDWGKLMGDAPAATAILDAAALMGMTLVIQTFVYPDAWPTHILWITAQAIILARGPGVLSLDALIGRRFQGTLVVNP